MAIAFLIVTRGQNIELKGSSVGTGADRLQNKLSTTLSAPIFMETANSGTTALLTPTLTAMATLSPQRLSLAETLDNISYRVIGLGFPLLTIGIIAGAVWANEAWGSYWSWDPKETWAANHLASFCRLSPCPHYPGMAGKKSGYSSSEWFCCGLGMLFRGESFR
jgi:ABC-type transport system involved in cytochrome c biogenesis permease subunit